jgi:tripartite-type tricarboxylate transporter receptor subunit TctC
MAIFAAQNGIDLLHVPYRGGSALVAGLVKNEVQAGWSGIPNVLPLIEAGQLRVLCISTRQRSASVPKVPTAIEGGVKDFDYATVMGLQTSAGTPRDVVNRLQAVAAKELREPDLTERMATLGMDLRENGTTEYVKFLQEDIARYRNAIATFKLQIN